MRLFILGLLTLLVSCSSTTKGKNQTAEAIQKELDAMTRKQEAGQQEAAVNNALLPPLSQQANAADTQNREIRFDLSVNNTPASQVFAAIVSGTRYSVVVPPDMSGNISMNLKDVTVFEALEAIRNTYGYDYKVDGSRIYVQGISMQTRIFQVNYLTGKRVGTSSLRVTSSSIADSATTTPTASGLPAPTQTPGGASGKSLDSSRINTEIDTNFWSELTQALQAIVGTDKGRNVVVSPMTGVIVVRAMPEELRSVATYLKASQVSLERQVMLEAKIIEVSLTDSLQTGVNWGSFAYNESGKAFSSVGQVAAGTTLSQTSAAATTLTGSALTSVPGSNLSGLSTNNGSVFGVAFQTGNFGALMNFLETQGSVHVLSSPRISTLNNQKAVLKVGTDEFFVTGVTTTTTAVGTSATTTPSVTLQPFFSGIALDVTPRIDANNEIILHVHPSVGQVTTVNKVLNLGASAGTYTLPLASSSISETDSIVRARDGQIVAIGGLMRQATVDEDSGLPGLSKLIFGQSSRRNEKRELVILIKPTVITGESDWSDDLLRSRDRINSMTR